MRLSVRLAKGEQSSFTPNPSRGIDFWSIDGHNCELGLLEAAPGPVPPWHTKAAKAGWREAQSAIYCRGMAFAHEQQEALYLLQGIENGTLGATRAAQRIEEADPALVYFIITWLRERYGGDHPAAEGVIGRLVELTGKFSGVKAQMREGKADPIVAWFEDEYSYRDFGAEDFIELIVEKLEG